MQGAGTKMTVVSGQESAFSLASAKSFGKTGENLRDKPGTGHQCKADWNPLLFSLSIILAARVLVQIL